MYFITWTYIFNISQVIFFATYFLGVLDRSTGWAVAVLSNSKPFLMGHVLDTCSYTKQDDI